MSKQDTLIMKGIALLMMIIVHLNMNQSLQLLFINNKSLLSIIHGGCSPVAFFLMLSGYGLMHVHLAGDNHHIGRNLKLFVHFWVILLIFVPLGALFVDAETYPGSILKFLENVTSFHTSYNYECWFIFPFVIISLSYPLTLKLLYKGGLVVLLVSCVCYLASGFIISHNHLIYKTAPHLIYNLLQVPFLLFPFLIGASLKRWSILELLTTITDEHLFFRYAVPICLIIMLLFYHQFVQTSAFAPFTSLLMFVSLFMLIKGRRLSTLKLIGEHSMNMWMIHTFFLTYIFTSFVYSFKYTILVFLVTFVLSLASSYIINLLTKRLDEIIYSSNV